MPPPQPAAAQFNVNGEKKKKKQQIDFNDPFDNFSKKKEFFLQN